MSLTKKDYPLGTNRPDLLFTPTKKNYEELTLEAALKGEVSSEDMRISPETLLMQAEIAESLERDQLGRNFRRAAELINISDERILEIYNALRPNRSTKEELLAIADELEQQYNAVENAKLVIEAAEVYERRGILRQEEE
ncbi:diol dehydratase small subunit [Halalkalibacter nanhaiisediminis]|uniref:Glycerol dehydratase small subunit/propanediol dehydratase small subunit n=1 Tax=Halalkalibacter nanhaiisediminis TaxID=688079 RepID=A0A562QL00_9BACI|nr:diol dehydratase small subunit [Halalkalibacter nanhaiisediminis]TWI56870.1 glycerol dehydratase small subunit/propanediol dehydratase small subunit [Halalkalibacter nanhaiisediminis]